MTNSIFLTAVTRRLVAPILCVAAALLGGCAITPSTPQSLVPATVDSATKHPQTVSVAAAGTVSHVSPETLAEALTASINKHKTFSRVIQGAGANYLLAVVLVNGDYPKFGASFTVKIDMAWSLKRADGTVVWQEVIKSEGLAGAGEAFAGSERIRMAGERAVLNNIAQGLGKISKLKL